MQSRKCSIISALQPRLQLLHCIPNGNTTLVLLTPDLLRQLRCHKPCLNRWIITNRALLIDLLRTHLRIRPPISPLIDRHHNLHHVSTHIHLPISAPDQDLNSPHHPTPNYAATPHHNHPPTSPPPTPSTATSTPHTAPTPSPPTDAPY